MVDAAWILIGDVAKRLRAIDTINDIFMSGLWRYFLFGVVLSFAAHLVLGIE